MIYWTLIFFSLLFCSLWASQVKEYNKKRQVFIILAVILIYLSSFRLGLGQDYSGYLSKIAWESETGVVNWFNEPLMTLVSLFVEATFFTPLLFFLLFSLVTISGVFSFYVREDNMHKIACMVIFTLFPLLFFNTFNLVRQFAAAGIFYYSITFIDKKEIFRFYICILFAVSIHLTALILLPLYFILDKKYHPITILLCVAGLFVFFKYAYPYIESYAVFDSRFGGYLDTDREMGVSGMIILYNLMGVLMLFLRRRFNNRLEIISFNLFFLFILFSNLSYVNYYFFRIAVYFSPVFAYVFPKLVSEIFGRKYSITASWLFGLFFLIPFLLGGINNPIIVPSGILPISALWDENIYKIVYSINPE